MALWLGQLGSRPPPRARSRHPHGQHHRLALTRQMHDLVGGLGWAYPRVPAKADEEADEADDDADIVDELPGNQTDASLRRRLSRG